MRAVKILHRLLDSVFGDAAKNWVKGGADSYDVEVAIKSFKLYKERGFIKGTESDMSQWVKRPFQDFIEFLHIPKQKFDAKQAESFVQKVADNQHVLAIEPQNFMSVRKYAGSTKWCIQNEKDYDFYNDNGVKFYFILSKILPKSNPLYKVAIYVKTTWWSDKKPTEIEGWDAEDNFLPKNKLNAYLRSVGLNIRQFVPVGTTLVYGTGD